MFSTKTKYKSFIRPKDIDVSNLSTDELIEGIDILETLQHLLYTEVWEYIEDNYYDSYIEPMTLNIIEDKVFNIIDHWIISEYIENIMKKFETVTSSTSDEIIYILNGILNDLNEIVKDKYMLPALKDIIKGYEFGKDFKNRQLEIWNAFIKDIKTSFDD